MKPIVSISMFALFAGAAAAEDINYNVTAETRMKPEAITSAESCLRTAPQVMAQSI